MSERKAFTLIELLVVVAIIAVLIAILLPALSVARDSAKAALCKGNLRSIAQILYLYGSNYNDYLPWTDMENYYYQGTMAGDRYGELRILRDAGFLRWRYAFPDAPDTSFKIFYCPVQSGSIHSYGYYPDPKGIFENYEYMGYFQYNHRNHITYYGGKPMKIGDDPRKICWSDTSELINSCGIHTFRGHNGYLNYLFIDGHVESHLENPSTLGKLYLPSRPDCFPTW